MEVPCLDMNRMNKTAAKFLLPTERYEVVSD